MLFSFLGCSTNPLSKIQILDNGIKTNYVVGEDIEIEDFSLKVTFKNNEEKIYNITEEMITLSNIDNYKVGTQDLNVLVDYQGTKIELILSITFDLPDEVINIINLIDALPDKENVNFSHESQIEKINNDYLNLEDKYKSYITNYSKYEESKKQMDLLKREFITPDFINKRFILKSNLDSFIYSLNEKDYSSYEWKEILGVYEECLKNLYLNENHEIIDELVINAKNKINNVHTISYKNVMISREKMKNKILEYKLLLDNNNYSFQNKLKLDLIVCKFIGQIDDLNKVEDIENLYNKTIEQLNNVDTLEEEEFAFLNSIISNKISVLNDIFQSIDVSQYSTINKNVIIEYYNESLNKIKCFTLEDLMDQEIKLFEYKVSKLKTIKIENMEILKNEKQLTLEVLYNLDNQIGIHKYDSKNRIIIENEISKAIENITVSEKVEEIIQIKNNLMNFINDVPTMYDQAILNLSNRIDANIKNIDNYLEKLNHKNYSKENWQIIEDLANNLKAYFKENITIYTYDLEIESMFNNLKNEINEIATLKEEMDITLNKKREEAINVLNNYYNSLNDNDFKAGMMDVIENKINDSKKMIVKLEDINSINKYVEDTIDVIEAAKK